MSRSEFPGRRGRVVASVIGAVLLVTLAVWAFELSTRYRWAEQELERIGDRHARLAGLIDAGEAISARAGQDASRLMLLVHPAEASLDQVGAAFQQTVRETAQAVGLEVATTQLLPVQSEGLYDRIVLSAMLNGSIDRFYEFFVRIEQLQPLPVVERVQLNPARQVRGQSISLTGNVTLSVVRVRS